MRAAQLAKNFYNFIGHNLKDEIIYMVVLVWYIVTMQADLDLDPLWAGNVSQEE